MQPGNWAITVTSSDWIKKDADEVINESQLIVKNYKLN